MAMMMALYPLTTSKSQVKDIICVKLPTVSVLDYQPSSSLVFKVMGSVIAVFSKLDFQRNYYLVAPPQFEIKSKNQTARRGEPVVLQCKAKGVKPICILSIMNNKRLDNKSDLR